MSAETVRRPVLQIPPNNWRVWFKTDVKGRDSRNKMYIDITADQVRVYKGRAKVAKIERIEANGSNT